MKIYLYSLLLAGFCFTACNQAKKQPGEVIKGKEKPSIDYEATGLVNLENSEAMHDILCQDWEYKEDVADLAGMDITSDMNVVYRGYCFFNDGTVIKDPRGYLRTGRWNVNMNEKPITISLEFDDGTKEINQLAYLAPYKMILSATKDNVKKTTDLIGEAIRHNELKDDPFYKDNVLWRIRPVSRETDKDIKQRLKDCIHFFILFYDEKINAHSDKVTFLGLPTCFNWHAGGIFLQKEDELQKKWIDCFYDKEQAMKAYRLANKLVTKKYEWPKKGNWLELNLAVLKQMEKEVDLID